MSARGRGVRCLVIDNYDSFTYNLVQIIDSLTGVQPAVVVNDDPGWRDEYLAGFDCVVISPGPGRPETAADFGICRSVIGASQVPLLGVCLGHQGICHSFGGRIVPAPEPMHGRTSLVRHNGDELFAGLPSPFQAVRYHSLLAGEVPAVLDVIAATPEGLPMAVRHRDRPLWGVQFHPESIGTDYGESLLANFLRQARPGGGQPQCAAVPGRKRPARQFRIIARRVACPVDAESVFSALYRDSPVSFWLDSAAPGRFSFLGDGSGPLARMATADVQAGAVTVTGAGGTERVDGSFFDWLRADLDEHGAQPPALPFGFGLGWVGYLGYELKAETGGAVAHTSPHPDAMMLFADRAIAFDHETGEVYLLALAGRDDGPASEWLDETQGRLARLSPAAAPAPLDWSGRLELRHSQDDYLRLIEACQRQIRAGETYEVCLTNQVQAPAGLDPWATYRLLRRNSPVPYGAFLRLGELSVLSASPERFLKIDAEGTAESRPIKGTRPRGQSPEQDAALAADLAASEKDRAENLMIVDLVRNDLGVTAIPGSVQVGRLFEVETFSTVHQLVSTIRSRLRPGLHAVDCVRAAFPGGSMTGAPKIRTMTIIDELEAAPRGIYSGALGYFSLTGAADLAITIRTLIVGPERISYGVGGAIIALSDPAAEFEETAVKARPLLTLLGDTFPANGQSN
jgi:para-aminobenzoate synthetase